MTCLLLAAALIPTLATGDADLKNAVKLDPPGVQWRINEASATMSPWIDANGWKILRHPEASYYYDVPARAAALATAEAFVYGANARVRTDAKGAIEFNQMVEFLRAIPELSLPPAANIGVIDDGSDETGELMNLLSRRNLLYRLVSAPDPNLKLNVRIGSEAYPQSEAADPAFLAQKIRGQLGDENRSLRLFGSEIVIGRMLEGGGRARVHLLNFASRKVFGLRVRVLGEYRNQKLFVSARPDAALRDVTVQGGATEFTLPDLVTYAVIDLTR